MKVLKRLFVFFHSFPSAASSCNKALPPSHVDPHPTAALENVPIGDGVLPLTVDNLPPVSTEILETLQA